MSIPIGSVVRMIGGEELGRLCKRDIDEECTVIFTVTGLVKVPCVALELVPEGEAAPPCPDDIED